MIVDMQFGSTGKGAIAAYLTKKIKFDSSVRVQSIQAGHTIYYKGKPYKMRTIPCAWVDLDVKLVLGAGCFIDKQLLLDEIKMIECATGEDVRRRLYVDYRAFYVEPCDILEEENRRLEKGMGSTAHGAGASLVRKLWRGGGGRVTDDSWADDNEIQVVDTIKLIQNHTVLVEGCQGTLLSIHTSPYYPFVTTRESTVSGIIAEAGISPFDVVEVHGVLRSYPIRVGGNSGDTGEKELTWEEVNARAGRQVEPERTTVTNRVRRIFEFSDKDFSHAIMINKPTSLYMTFADYIAPEVYGAKTLDQIPFDSRIKVLDFVAHVNSLSGSASVKWIGTGEREYDFIEL